MSLSPSKTWKAMRKTATCTAILALCGIPLTSVSAQVTASDSNTLRPFAHVETSSNRLDLKSVTNLANAAIEKTPTAGASDSNSKVVQAAFTDTAYNYGPTLTVGSPAVASQGTPKQNALPTFGAAPIYQPNPIPRKVEQPALAIPSVSGVPAIASLPVTPTTLAVPTRTQRFNPQTVAPRRTAFANRASANPALVSMDQAKSYLLQAYEIAANASHAQEYTNIIDLCEHAGTIQLDRDVETYRTRLASWAYNLRGEKLVDAGQEAAALADFDKAIQLDQTRWQAWHNRAVSYAQAGRLKESFDNLCQTISIRPNHAKSYANRGALYEQAGKLSVALQDFRDAISLDPTLSAAHAGRGRVSYRLKSYDIALSSLEEAIRLNPNNATFFKSRGDVLAAKNDYRAALESYGVAIQKNAYLAEAYRNGAWLTATCPDKECRNGENGVATATKALELANNTERHLYLDTLAAAYANNGKYEAASQTVREAIQIAPQNMVGSYQARLQLYQQRQPYRMASLRKPLQ